ncbi:hypothetical protein AAKU55_003071 [Oxalobacteraceae bacterium GrIS 1.11]
MNQVLSPLRGAELEKWRIRRGLTVVMAADAFGLQKGKWEELTAEPQSSSEIADPVVAMLLHLYQQYPEAAPARAVFDVREFYEFLGLKDSPQDREMFASLIGRSPPSVIRLMLHEGTPGRPLVRWLEAVRKLKLTPKQTLKVMTEVASTVGGRQGMSNVLTQGWKRQPGTIDDE